MSLSVSTINYTLANGVIAFVGLGLTLVLGRELGQDDFGVWASFFSAQNIWAGLGFMRLETRLATCKSIYQANRIIYAGFFAGLLVSFGLALLLMVVERWTTYYWLAVLSGFALAIFDVLSQRMAYEGKQLAVLKARCARVLLPLVVAVFSVLTGATTTQVIQLQGALCIIFALIIWGRWIGPRRWWRLSTNVISQYRYGLLPTLIMSLLNGVWINGMTPALNHLASSALAGQFAILQRLVGGTLGLLSTAITLGMLKKDYVEVHWPTISRVLLINILISILLCLLLGISLTSNASHMLGFNWTFDLSVYWATCAFLVASFSIGAISAVAIRLKDEWFLTIWQFTALISWVVIYYLMPFADFLVTALWFGTAMYVFLGLRWRHLSTKSDNNDRSLQNP